MRANQILRMQTGKPVKAMDLSSIQNSALNKSNSRDYSDLESPDKLIRKAKQKEQYNQQRRGMETEARMNIASRSSLQQTEGDSVGRGHSAARAITGHNHHQLSQVEHSCKSNESKDETVVYARFTQQRTHNNAQGETGKALSYSPVKRDFASNNNTTREEPAAFNVHTIVGNGNMRLKLQKTVSTERSEKGDTMRGVTTSTYRAANERTAADVRSTEHNEQDRKGYVRGSAHTRSTATKANQKVLAREDLSSSDESEYQEHNIWGDNSVLKWRGIDTDNAWTDQDNAKVNLFSLYKARFESFVTKREGIRDLEVIDYMKRFAKTRSLKNNNYPWNSFRDDTSYVDDFEGTRACRLFQRFAEYHRTYYSATQGAGRWLCYTQGSAADALASHRDSISTAIRDSASNSTTQRRSSSSKENAPFVIRKTNLRTISFSPSPKRAARKESQENLKEQNPTQQSLATAAPFAPYNNNSKQDDIKNQPITHLRQTQRIAEAAYAPHSQRDFIRNNFYAVRYGGDSSVYSPNTDTTQQPLVASHREQISTARQSRQQQQQQQSSTGMAVSSNGFYKAQRQYQHFQQGAVKNHSYARQMAKSLQHSGALRANEDVTHSQSPVKYSQYVYQQQYERNTGSLPNNNINKQNYNIMREREEIMRSVVEGRLYSQKLDQHFSTEVPQQKRVYPLSKQY